MGTTALRRCKTRESKKDQGPGIAQDVNLKQINHHITIGEMTHKVSNILREKMTNLALMLIV